MESERQNSEILQGMDEKREKLDQQKQQMDKQHQLEMSDLTGKISKLEKSLKEEKTRANEAETRLAKQVKESAKVKAMFADAERNLQQQKKLQKEKNCLINEHQVALAKEKKQMAMERKEWERKNSELSQEIAKMRKDHEERSAPCDKAEKDFSEKFAQVEKQMKQQQATIAEKVTTINNLEGTLKELLDQQNQLETDREDLERKNSKLSHEIAQMRKDHEERIASFDKAEKEFSEKIAQVEKQMELQETSAEKVTIINNFDGVLEEKLDQQKQQMDKQHQLEMSDLTDKISKLENSLQEEKTRANEAETRLAKQVKESAEAKAMLVNTEQNLQQQKNLQEEKNCLINEHQLALSKEKKQMAMERTEWERKNSELSEEMAQMRKDHEERSATFDKAEKEFSEKFAQVKKQMEQLQDTIAEKVTIINNFDGVLEEKLDQQKQQMDKQHQLEMSDLTDKILKLEISVKKDKTRANEAENSLVQKGKELAQIKAVLIDTEQNLQQLKKQSEKDKNCLINEHQLALSNEKKQLAKERKDLERQNSEFSQEIATMRKDHEERSATFDKAEKEFSEKFAKVEKQMEQLHDTIAKKVTIINNFEGVLKEKLDQQKQQMDKQHQLEMSDLTGKISKLENSLKDEKTRANEAENRLTHQLKESAQLKAVLVDTEQNLQQHKQQIEKEKDRLINDHQLALTKVQKQLAKGRKEWERQKSDLSQKIDQMRKDHEERSATFDKAEKDFSEKFDQAQKQIQQLQDTIAQKVTIMNTFDCVMEEKLAQHHQQVEIVKEKYRQENADLFLQMSQLKTELQEEKMVTMTVKRSFELEAKESAKLRVAFLRVEKDLEFQKQQWQTELLNVHQPTASALTETQKQLEEERLKWQEEKMAFLQQIADQKIVVSKLKTKIRKTAKVNKVKLEQLQLQVEEQKKAQKKSLGMRFLNLFKTNRKGD
ncbi:myosin-9-like [Oryzias melastigma]|uniref:myosin-9-like n=1 Tax=Oryzias melastigma TaxID=30732 RepID=UPI000CF7C49D|nr:myosin-9-like [Oryzias melastigma]